MKRYKNYRKANRKSPSGFKRFLKRFNWKKIFIKTGLGVLVAFVLFFAWVSKDLPTPSRINKKINIPSTQILDRNGDLIYAVSGDKKRLVVPLSEIPDHVKHATIALEDKNFYKHHGIDLTGIARSVIKNVTSNSRVGGSTITQQFIKNALLSPSKTITRKAKEAILAVELEVIYPKDKILELYLNEIPYGSTAYGIEAASNTYFNKSAKDLTLAESATLAALPQAPTYYSPYGEHVDILLKRKDYALEQMAEQGYVSEEEAEEAKQQEIKFQPRKDSIKAPHFVFYVQKLIADKYGEEQLQNGGLKITTSLDQDAQKLAEESIEKGKAKLDRYGANNAALTAIDPATGQVLAMVGSVDYFNSDIQGQVNVTTSLRQPGSSFKPIVYATGFKGKYNPASPLFDLKTDFGGNYSPDNYNGRTSGPVTIRHALSNSLNIPAVKMLSLVGLNEALKTSKDLGITSLNSPDKYGLSLVLGSGEVSPLEMAGAYGVLGNEGKRNPINPILKIENQDGKILEEFKKAPQKQVLDPQAAYLVSDILSDNGARSATFGFTRDLTIPGRQVAVKTGTTNSNRDAWTVGYTPQVATAVWTGNTNNTEMKQGADGSIVAAPIWNNFMAGYLKDKQNKNFARPSEIKDVSVDFLSNKLPTSSSPQNEIKTDKFASWHVPTERDDIHIVKRVNRINEKLATDQTPAELIEERLYANIRSERPDDSNWEGPVQAWARANGYDHYPPTEQDDMYTSIDQRPAISIISPKQNSTVSGSFDISVNARAEQGIQEIVIRIDGNEIGRSSSSPYSVRVSSEDLSSGSHQISAEVADVNGIRAQSESITINVEKDSNAPKISQIDATTTENSAKLTWNTNKESTGVVEYGKTPALGQSVSSSTLSTSHTINFQNLEANTIYYFKITAKDKQNNTSTSQTQSFQTKKNLLPQGGNELEETPTNKEEPALIPAKKN